MRISDINFYFEGPKHVKSSCLTWPRFFTDPSCSRAPTAPPGWRRLLVLPWCRAGTAHRLRPGMASLGAGLHLIRKRGASRGTAVERRNLLTVCRWESHTLMSLYWQGGWSIVCCWISVISVGGIYLRLAWKGAGPPLNDQIGTQMKVILSPLGELF